MKILIAEDDPTIQQVLELFLSRKGMACSVADNGLDALRKWQENGYDVVLMDLQMPVMDGLKATQMIREEERGRGGHTRIIALTAYAMAADRQRCLDNGMDDYLSKPVDFDRLLSLLTDSQNFHPA